MNRDFDVFQTALCRSEDQIEVPERVKIVKIMSLRGNLSIRRVA